MGIIICLYEQRALASLLQELREEKPNLDSATQTVRDIFAMSSKVLDQLGRTGAYDHFIRRKATIMDIGVDSIKDIAKYADPLPLTGDGVLGKDFENKLKKKEGEKQRIQRPGTRIQTGFLLFKEENHFLNKCERSKTTAF